jgi:alkyl sulfatase BDS1-like metallo-beta-lactamase superfamily hydrolase
MKLGLDQVARDLWQQGIMNKKIISFSLICFIFAFALSSCDKAQNGLLNIAENQKLAEHSKEFKKKIYKVDNGVYTAVGYGIANSIMLVGKDGVIIVDTMETKEAGREVWNDLKKLTRLPLKAIIYTHFHPDHIYGAEAYAEKSTPDIYAHETTDNAVTRFTSETAPIIGARSMRMYGTYLDKKAMINVGIGPFLSFGPDSTLGYIPPTKTFRDRLKVTIAGIKVELIHAPGETDDQIYVWLPDRKILMCADNIYKSFPNLYTIRGTWFRSLKNWYRSVDVIRDLQPEYLVPAHGQPVMGAAAINRIATDYRDAIQFVHDQSLRAINKGMTPDEIVQYIKLPEHLASSPYLQEYYGKVSWSARSMFTGNLGWFSGDSADLQPLSPKEQAEMMAEISGGETKLLDYAKKYLDKGNHQAALQLSGYIIRLNPENKKAREVRIKALIALGERESNANARHYYLTEALEMSDKFVARPKIKLDSQMVKRFPLSLFFDSLAVNLDPIKSADLDKRVGIKFTDTGEAYTIHVRRGVAEITPRLKDNLDMLVYADSGKWKEMLAKLRSPVTTLAGFKYPKGNVIEFANFLKNFENQSIQLSFEGKSK